MQRSTRSLLLKSISRHPFPRSSKPISPSLPKFPAEAPNPSAPTRSSITTRPISSFSHSRLNSTPNPSTQFGDRAGGRREFSSGEPVDYSKEVDVINVRFAEAREEIEAALDSKETVYFDEEAECAREAVAVVLKMFAMLLARLPEKDRSALQRSMGLKIEQLKAELKQLDD